MDKMQLPIFIDMGAEEEVDVLRKYIGSKGEGCVRPEATELGVEANLKEIINVCDSCCNKVTELEALKVLNGIVSIIVRLDSTEKDSLIHCFTEKLVKSISKPVALRVLWSMFQIIKSTSPVSFHVYYHIIQLAEETDQVRSVFVNLRDMEKWLPHSPLTTEQLQQLLRRLHQALVRSKESGLAAQVMIDLLGTYTTENASQAREDAQRCVLAAIADPETFLLDPLLSLKPVRSLEKELGHDLLQIFVSGKLSDYKAFVSKHQDFIQEVGLDHEANMKKMRLLTFMQLAEGVSEMSFNTITSELQIEESEVEAFVIDLLKTKLVRGRMDQAAKKVHISSTMHRTFGAAQWEQLRQTLRSWKANLVTVQDGMVHVVHAQLEIAQRAKASG